MPQLLVVDDNTSSHNLFKSVFVQLGHELFFARSGQKALEVVASNPPDAVIVDAVLPDGSGLDFYRRIIEIDANLPVIVMTASSDSRQAIEAVKLGALDYLVEPLNFPELAKIVERAFEIRRLAKEPVTLDPESLVPADGDLMIGRCPAMHRVYKAIGRVASQNVTVLIRGESGTGKELVARALFQFGDRCGSTFMAINCAAIPEPLLESELFGHEKGAFTGADKKRIGKFEQCNGGTLFLDEVGDMSLVLQSKLLRVMQEKEFERVGGNETVRTDVRVIAATNRDFEAMVEAGTFRADLYYRLNGYSIYLPPLRERDEDLDLLIEHFRRVANEDLGKSVKKFDERALDRLKKYSWPGNVRELQSVVRQSVLQTSGKVVLEDFLPLLASEETSENYESTGELASMIDSTLQSNTHHLYDTIIEHVERVLIQRVLVETAGSQVDAARILGITRTTLRSKIAKLGIVISRSVQAGR